MPTLQDWEWLAASSEYQTAVLVQQLLAEGKLMEANQGLYTLIESMGKSKKLALMSQLTRLMAHVIKWKCLPEMRSSSWSITIRPSRNCRYSRRSSEFKSQLYRIYLAEMFKKSSQRCRR